MRALMENPEQREKVLADPSIVPAVVEEALRMFPAFAHFARTATRDTELHGQTIRKGEKVVMWYPSSNRDETRYEDPDRFDVSRNPEHQAFGAGGRHFCLGTALARLELRVLIEETLRRYPRDGDRGRAAVRRVAVRQPAEDAAGPAARRLALVEQAPQDLVRREPGDTDRLLARAFPADQLDGAPLAARDASRSDGGGPRSRGRPRAQRAAARAGSRRGRRRSHRAARAASP